MILIENTNGVPLRHASSPKVSCRRLLRLRDANGQALNIRSLLTQAGEYGRLKGEGVQQRSDTRYLMNAYTTTTR